MVTEKEFSDFEFAKINFNKSTEEMQVDLKKTGVPHLINFNETYGEIKVQNAIRESSIQERHLWKQTTKC